MSERKDEQWLDGELQRAVDGTTPVFDAEVWKQKHHAEYDALLSRKDATSMVGWGLSHRNRGEMRNRWGKPHPTGLRRWYGALAVAAAVMIVAGVLLLGRRGPDSQPVPGPSATVQSPAQMMTMMSLQAAYQQGGTEALERQFDKALQMLGPRTTSISPKELLES